LIEESENTTLPGLPAYRENYGSVFPTKEVWPIFCFPSGLDIVWRERLRKYS
jgi:hypothetical protein